VLWGFGASTVNVGLLEADVVVPNTGVE